LNLIEMTIIVGLAIPSAVGHRQYSLFDKITTSSSS
jgi:hypothetical protein